MFRVFWGVPGFLRGVPGFLAGVPGFLGLFLVFFWCSWFFGCSGMFRDVPVFRCSVFRCSWKYYMPEFLACSLVRYFCEWFVNVA